jgi:chorismate lyase / 3-hydroxybenzoate synthase
MQNPKDGTQLFVSSPLALTDHTPSRSRALQNHLLGSISFGVERPNTNLNAPCQHLHAAPLHLTEHIGTENWLSSSPLTKIVDDTANCHGNQDILWGVIELAEPLGMQDGAPPLDHSAKVAYQQLFSILDRHDYPYLWRAWNYMPDITGITYRQERYQQFNAGRQKGFAASARAVTGNVPAACAIGVHGGPLSVAFLAGRKPTIALENPRQISAYHYPDQYGALRPTFSRASLATLHQQELLLLSGTASILGHETTHIGDIAQQTQETLRNIQAVLDQANLHTQSNTEYQLHDLQLRAYVRHAKDIDVVRNIVNASMKSSAEVLYLNADICRQDLDIEIEGIAWKTIAPTSPN